MVAKFTPPSFVPGCEVKSIADADEYTTDNGWIEAIVGGDNQQRIRYYGTPQGVKVGDFVDVEYFPAYKLYRVFGSTLGGTAVVGGVRVSKVWESDFENDIISIGATGKTTIQASAGADSTDFLQVLDADGGTPILNVDSTNERVGIGTSTIPHGGIGWAKLALDGANASSSGPHIQLTTASDDYPLLQILGFSHDNVHLNFDSYWEGAWKSSDPGSNFKISKLSDQLVFSYDDGIAAGSTLSWNNGIIMDTDGHVGIGIDPVSGILQIAGTTSVGGEAALFFDADATGAGTEYGIRILGDASAKSGGSYLFLGIHGGVLGSYSKASIWIGNEASRPGINCGFSQTVLAPTHGAIFAGDVGLNGVSSPSTALDIGAGAMEFDEMTAPAAGAANTVRLFARDDGGGDTELCARFSSGLIQVISPLEFGEISVKDNTTATTISTINVKVQYLLFDTNGVSNGATPDHTNDHITVNKPGTYLITCSLTAESVAGAGAKFSFEIYKNNGTTLVGALHAHRQLSGGGTDTGSVSLSGLIGLSSGDTIELWVTNNTNTQNIVIEDVSLSITMVGGS
jgi:hypothetical protein